MQDREIDARGLPCPRPVVMAKKALDDMGEGVLRILVSQEVQCRNLIQIAQALGLRAEAEPLENGYCVTIWKTEPLQSRAAATSGLRCEQLGHGTVVFFSADTIGRGNDELGRLLARLALQALSEMDTPPTRILLMNTGVRLACEGAPTIEALQALQSKGTEILVCGTCLDFLGLLDDLRVGTVSNMHDILEVLTTAGRVVSM